MMNGLEGSEGWLPQPTRVARVLAGVNEEFDLAGFRIIGILNELLCEGGGAEIVSIAKEFRGENYNRTHLTQTRLT